MTRALLPLYLLALALAAPALADDDDDLAPPNATPYLELLLNSTDLAPFVDQRDTSLKLRFGFRFNDSGGEALTWSGEGGLSLLGDDSETFTITQAINDPGSPFEEERQRVERTVRINGFELGARADFRDLFYLRGGVFIYSVKERDDIVVTQIDFDDASNNNTFERVPSSDSSNDVAPYASLGATWQLDESFGLLAEVSGVSIDSELLESVSLGIRLEF